MIPRVIGYILIFSVIGGVLSLVGGLAMLVRQQWSRGAILVMVSFAAGVLLATSFADLLPEALELSRVGGGEPSDIFFWSLAAMAGFFLFERSFVWFHHHHTPHKGQPAPLVGMVWFGDTLHNAIDGLVITASFLVSVPLGITTSIAVGAHELPQEIADFSIYLARGVPRSTTVLLNVLSSLATVAAALGAYFFWDLFSSWQPQLLAFTAGMFIYIAGSDLIPELHGEYRRQRAWMQSIAFLMGIVLVIGLGRVFHV